MDNQNRGSFTGKLGYVLSAAGASVGLGNIWRFPYLAAKYGGGVFCRLYDGVTDVLCSYDSLQNDGDFKIGDSAEIVINKYNPEKKLVYGKILRKMLRR